MGEASIVPSLSVPMAAISHRSRKFTQKSPPEQPADMRQPPFCANQVTVSDESSCRKPLST